MPAPIPVVTPIATFTELPAGGLVPLSCGLSTALPGAMYEWQLIEAPEGSTAVLQNATTSTPTLTNVDMRGTYIVFLKITDSGGSSHPQPYPVQATTVPYGFSTPLATAFGVVRVAEAMTGLVKPGRGEYGWFEQGLWPIIAKMEEGLQFEYYDEPTRTLTANSIVPDASTGATAVSLNGLNVTPAAGNIVVTTDDAPLLVGAPTTFAEVDVTVDGGTLRTDIIRDASGGELEINSNSELSLVCGENKIIVSLNPEILIDAAAGNNAVRIRADDQVFIEPYNDLNLTATTGDVVVTAPVSDVRVTAAADILLTTTGTDGDIALSTEGATGNINISTEGYVAGITVATEGSDAGISIITTGSAADISISAKDDLTLATAGAASTVALSAPGASSNISLTAANGITITSTNTTSAADITLTSGNDLAAYSTGLARLSGGTTEVIGVTQLSLTTDDGNGVLTVGGDAIDYTEDRYAQVTFYSENNKSRVIDLDGYVSQRNHRLTAGGSTTQITPNGTLTYVPLRNDVVAEYIYEALAGGGGLTPNFVLSFQAAFTITQFTASVGNYFTLELTLVPSLVAPPATVTLATVTFQPENSIEVTAQPCIITGTVHSTGGKFLYTAATASLQLNSSQVVTRLSSIAANASFVLNAGDPAMFVFRANSNDSNAIIGNLSASFTLMRGS